MYNLTEYRLNSTQSTSIPDLVFDIRDYQDVLTLDGSGDPNSYLCELCGAKNFKIDTRTGKYNTFTCDCMTTDLSRKDLVKAIVTKKNGQWQKSPRKAQRRTWDYEGFDGQPLKRVVRTDNGEGGRKLSQESLVQGIKKPAEITKPVAPYKYQECLEAQKQGQVIFWVEGEGKADALWELGIPATTTIGGTTNLRNLNYQGLFNERLLVIAPDRDKPGVEYALKIHKFYQEAQFAKLPPSDFYWSHLPPDHGADIFDYIQDLRSQHFSNDQIQLKIMGAIVPTLFQPLPEIKSLPEVNPPQQERPAWGKSKNANLWHTLEYNWGSKLKFNEMTLRVEMDGQPYDLDLAFIDVATEFDLDSGTKAVQSMIRKLALRNSYHPFREYLKTLINHPDPADISNLATRYLGNDDPLANVMIKKTLIALARRTFEPGCKVDTVCIFQGQTGWKKSTFWETLVTVPFFCDNLSEGGANKKDEKLKLRRYSIIEYSEIDTVWRQKDVSEMKAFLSSKVDSIRPPYAAAIEDFPRSSIFVGTTNKPEFLSDPTGERRYWVLEANKRIDVKALEKEREQILAAAVKLHLAGEIHWLTEEEDKLLEQSNKEFKKSDVWEDLILDYLHQTGADSCAVMDILTNLLKMEAKDIRTLEQMRVADILTANGWKKGKHKWVEGKRTRFWEKGSVGGVAPPPNNLEVVPEVVLPSSPVVESVSETATLPTPLFCTNLKHSDENSQLNEQELDLVDFIRTAIASGDSQTAQHLQGTIKTVCDTGETDREKVWAALTEAEQEIFSDLVATKFEKKRKLVEATNSPEATSKILTPSEMAKLNTTGQTNHYYWQLKQLSNSSPGDEIFQQLLPTAYLGVLKSLLIKIDNKNGATARAVEAEMMKRGEFP